MSENIAEQIHALQLIAEVEGATCFENGQEEARIALREHLGSNDPITAVEAWFEQGPRWGQSEEYVRGYEYVRDRARRALNGKSLALVGRQDSDQSPIAIEQAIEYLHTANTYGWLAFSTPRNQTGLFNARVNAATSAYAAAVLLDLLRQVSDKATATALEHIQGDGITGFIPMLSARFAENLGGDASNWLVEARAIDSGESPYPPVHETWAPIGAEEAGRG